MFIDETYQMYISKGMKISKRTKLTSLNKKALNTSPDDIEPLIDFSSPFINQPQYQIQRTGPSILQEINIDLNHMNHGLKQKKYSKDKSGSRKKLKKYKSQDKINSHISEAYQQKIIDINKKLKEKQNFLQEQVQFQKSVSFKRINTLANETKQHKQKIKQLYLDLNKVQSNRTSLEKITIKK